MYGRRSHPEGRRRTYAEIRDPLALGDNLPTVCLSRTVRSLFRILALTKRFLPLVQEDPGSNSPPATWYTGIGEGTSRCRVSPTFSETVITIHSRGYSHEHMQPSCRGSDSNWHLSNSRGPLFPTPKQPKQSVHHAHNPALGASCLSSHVELLEELVPADHRAAAGPTAIEIEQPRRRFLFGIPSLPEARGGGRSGVGRCKPRSSSPGVCAPCAHGRRPCQLDRYGRQKVC